MSEKRRGNFISLQTRITNSIKWQKYFEKGKKRNDQKEYLQKSSSFSLIMIIVFPIFKHSFLTSEGSQPLILFSSLDHY